MEEYMELAKDHENEVSIIKPHLFKFGYKGL